MSFRIFSSTGQVTDSYLDLWFVHTVPFSSYIILFTIHSCTALSWTIDRSFYGKSFGMISTLMPARAGLKEGLKGLASDQFTFFASYPSGVSPPGRTLFDHLRLEVSSLGSLEKGCFTFSRASSLESFLVRRYFSVFLAASFSRGLRSFNSLCRCFFKDPLLCHGQDFHPCQLDQVVFSIRYSTLILGFLYRGCFLVDQVIKPSSPTVFHTTYVRHTPRR